MPIDVIVTPAVLPIILSVTKFAEVSTFPVTANDDNVPTDVTFGCAPVVTVDEVPVTDPTIGLVTVNPVKVPVDVMFG